MSTLSLTDAQVRSILDVWAVTTHKKPHGKGGVAVLAVRDADGDGNEFGVYDDRAYIVTSKAVSSFSFNTDPSNYGNGRAQMECGQIITYRAGKHKLAYPGPRGYAAFRQQSEDYFNRKGSGREKANIAANMHKGGASGGTSSLACQTVPVGNWPAFRALIYSALGITESEVMAHPMGTGDTFEYLILSRAQVAEALEKASKTPIAPPTPAEAPPSYKYFLPDGRQLTEVRMVVGAGYGPVRKTMALFLNVADPALLSFALDKDGTDEGDHPDFFFVDRAGRRKPIDLLDDTEESDRVWGSLKDMAAAAGLSPKVDTAKKEVHFVAVVA